MDLDLERSRAYAYSSNSQSARVLTEAWALREMYCLACGHPSLSKYPNNKPVADFVCQVCGEDYELKSSSRRFGRKVTDGAYSTMLDRLKGNNVPNLLLMTYSQPKSIATDLLAIPSRYFVHSLVEPRPPLSKTARRAGWVGCNIVLDNVPLFGRVQVLVNQSPVKKSDVLEMWQRSKLLTSAPSTLQRGWTLDVWRCIERIQKEDFALRDLYAYEDILRQLHPNNKNVRPKIRQQLQVLRDSGLVHFVGRGHYRLNLA